MWNNCKMTDTFNSTINDYDIRDNFSKSCTQFLKQCVLLNTYLEIVRIRCEVVRIVFY